MTDEEVKVERWLREPSQLIVAFCPVCGGWTMFVTTESESAKDWTRACQHAGDLIVKMRTTTGMGPVCPQSDVLLRERTCDQ